MSSTYLLCKRRGARVLVPATDVVGVRELTLYAPPPDSLAWLSAVAIGDEGAILVADTAAEPNGAARSDEPRRVVVLQTKDAAVAQVALLVDEVVDMQTYEPQRPEPVGDLRWLDVDRQGEPTFLVATERLRAEFA